MKNILRILSSTCLIFMGLFFLSSCNRALHNEGRTAFLNIYVNLLDQNGVATSKHDICPIISRYNTVPDQMPFKKTLQKDDNTVSTAFSYWGNFRETGVQLSMVLLNWRSFIIPLKKRNEFFRM